MNSFFRKRNVPFSGKILGPIGCVFALILTAGASLAIGSRPIAPREVMNALSRREAQTMEEAVIHKRIPRTIGGLIAGAGLGMAGALMQGLTRNPLADPGILGVNSGAALFVAGGMAFLGAGRLEQYIWLALIGAGLSAVLVYVVGSIGIGGASPLKLALAGAFFSAACSALTSAVLLPRERVMEAFRFWQVGGIGGTTWPSLRTVAPFLGVGILLGLGTARSLDILALGDETAAALGVRVGLIRLLVALAGVLLCGSVTAFAGPIGFIGLMVPHAVRLLAGPEQGRRISLSAGGGAFLLLISDIAGRLIGRPGELEAGLVTAFLGGPVLIVLARKSRIPEL